MVGDCLAVPIKAIVDGVEIAWKVFMLAQTPPLHAGETFTVKPYLYTAGTYNYGKSGISYLDQPAHLSYADDTFSATGTGVGGWGVEIFSGDVSIGYYTPGIQSYTTFTVSGYPDNYFLVSGSADYYTHTAAQYRSIYVNRRSVEHSFSGLRQDLDYFIAFQMDGFGSTNIQNNSGASNIGNVIPIYPGSQITYSEALEIYIDYWRDKYPDWTELDTDDFPTEQDFIGEQPTEPTEPVSTSFLTKPELEDVLSSESYSLQPFPTNQIFDFSSIQIPTETISVEYLEFFPSIFSISWDYFSSLGLATPLLIFGFLFLLIRILRGR